ncbi:serine/threonine-protein kinase [Nonomuraea indica]|uniref:non-specific serine/threonine protein kinase n=1 Tax=Nonomuraea indica TaxID=1581193 RepID=A0ABW8AGW0_9ACTN
MTRQTIGGRYELDPLSRRGGGMGEVWFGFDKRLDRPIAIKFIRVDRLPDGKPDNELAQRFVRESRITARLEHPGVPAVYDCGTHQDNLYLVMQQIPGVSVQTLIDETEIPIPWAAAIAAQVCSVLAAAHTNSLIHRDLKPSNLMLTPEGAVKVLDFGVAAAISPTATRLTRTGMTVGTPEYMAPEQAMAGTTGPQADLYSLGVVLDEMLSGTNQFGGPTPLASLRNHIERVPQPLRRRRRDVPEKLEKLVLWMLEKSPDHRPASAADVYERLLEYCSDLPPFPAYVNAASPQPVRMYAGVVGRVGAPTKRDAGGTAPVPMPSARSRTVDVSFRLSDISYARKDAEVLKAESRFTQAAEVLGRVVRPAVETLGALDPEVLTLRIELADVLFLGGDYRRAAPEFAQLAVDIAQREGSANDLALRFRMMEANALAMLGDTNLALLKLRQLLADERRFGVDEDRILELRRQIGLLELGAGDAARARETLGPLLKDLVRRYGTDHPSARAVREILEGLDS